MPAARCEQLSRPNLLTERLATATSLELSDNVPPGTASGLERTRKTIEPAEPFSQNPYPQVVPRTLHSSSYSARAESAPGSCRYGTRRRRVRRELEDCPQAAPQRAIPRPAKKEGLVSAPTSGTGGIPRPAL